MPCVACREVAVGVLSTLRYTRLTTTYSGPPTTAPEPLPPLRVTCPCCPALAAQPNPNRHTVCVSHVYFDFDTTLTPHVDAGGMGMEIGTGYGNGPQKPLRLEQHDTPPRGLHWHAASGTILTVIPLL